jgi:hypothetical protein
LTNWGEVDCHIDAAKAGIVNLDWLTEYRDLWRSQAENA